MKIAIFYHIAQIGMWPFIYQQQIHRLWVSGLFESSSYIHFGVNGEDFIFNVPPKTNVMYNHKEYWDTEKETLLELKKFCNENPCYKVLYLHTKGVSKSSIYVNSWRLMMEYFVLDRWKECVNYLNCYDCVGVEMNIVGPTLWSNGKLTENDSTPFFAGNFWWANASYINTIQNRYLDSDCRLEKERWIGDGKYGCRSKNLFKSSCGVLDNPYQYYFSEGEYFK